LLQHGDPSRPPFKRSPHLDAQGQLADDALVVAAYFLGRAILMDYYPTSIEMPDAGHLAIVWNDGRRSLYAISRLRNVCPCATCREKRSQPPPLLPVLAAGEAQPLRLVDLKPVGNYAYGLAFSDGHSTGIFSLDFLRELDEAQGNGRPPPTEFT
jgi:DUF971 family protein